MVRSSNLSPFDRHLRDILASAAFDVDAFPRWLTCSSRRPRWRCSRRAAGSGRRPSISRSSWRSRLPPESSPTRSVSQLSLLRRRWTHTGTAARSEWSGHPWVQLWGSVPKNDPHSWDRRDADLSQRIIPMLVDHASDEGLVRCWREHPRHWGVPRARRLLYRALLERATGADPTTTIGLLRRFLRRCPSAPGLSGMEPGLAALELTDI